MSHMRLFILSNKISLYSTESSKQENRKASYHRNRKTNNELDGTKNVKRIS